MKTFLLASLVAGAALFATAADQPAGLGASFKGPLGLQLYSLRDGFKTDVPGTLDKVKAFGFTAAELAGTYGKTPEQFTAMLAERGIKAVAGHFPYGRFKTDPESVAKEAKALGLSYAGCAWADHKSPVTEEQIREIAGVFNKAGEALAKHGLKFYYHNHGYEFQPHGDGTLFDLLISLTDPKLVAFEMDVLWVQHPGQDPVKLLEKHGARWELMHLKDLRKDIKGDLSGHTDTKNDVTLGTGQVDMVGVLKAAQKAGVKWYFIEDESPTVLEQIPNSLKFLEQASW